MIRRGEVYWCAVGTKTRPVVVVSGDLFNETRLDTVVVVPVYSSGQRPTHVHVEVEPTSGGVQGWANALEISVQRRTLLSEWVGTVSARELAEIDAAIRLVLFEELP